ncbi:MAG: DUF3784 domain-containing protein [Lachnospiraceae bacterium]|nr:DUF3784 domain-containing protein [Lachnospiraceae bacterium]
MGIFEIIITVVLFLTAIGSFVISFLQFKERGLLLNNAYFYASKEERAKMDKKPHYRQSGIVFAFIGTGFLLYAAEMILGTGWLFYAVLAVALITIVYAVVSSVISSVK